MDIGALPDQKIVLRHVLTADSAFIEHDIPIFSLRTLLRSSHETPRAISRFTLSNSSRVLRECGLGLLQYFAVSTRTVFGKRAGEITYLVMPQ